MTLMRFSGREHPATRIAVLLFTTALVVIIAAGLYSGYLSGRQTWPQAQRLADRQPMLVADPGASVSDPLPAIPAHQELNRYHLDVAEHTPHPDKEEKFFGAGMAINELFGWLKTRSHANLAAGAWPRGRWTWDKVMREPERWRAQILHVYGLMLDRKVVTLEGPDSRPYKVWRVLLHDFRLRETYAVLTPLVPAGARPPRGGKRGTYLACDGAFLKLYPYLTRSGWKWTPLMIARRVCLTSEGPTPRAWLDERGDPGRVYKDIRPKRTVDRLDIKFLEAKLVAPPKDLKGYRMLGGDIREEARNISAEKAALDHAFEYIWHFTDAELARAVNPEINFVTLMHGTQAPAWTRGQVVRCVGRAGSVEPWRFAQDGTGIRRIYLLFVHDTRYTNPKFVWALATLNLPPGLRADDAITAEGVFLKLYPYKSTAGEWHWAPLIVCKAIHRVPDDHSNSNTLIALVAGLGALVIMLLLMARRDTTDMEAMRSRFQQRRLQREGGRLKPEREQGADDDGPRAHAEEPRGVVAEPPTGDDKEQNLAP